MGVTIPVAMKRHAALQPLSRDHHVALAVAVRLRRATDDSASDAREAFLAFWEDHGAAHFRVEEDVLLPAFAEHADPDEACVVRMLVDHVRIRAAAQRLRNEPHPSAESLHDLGTALERHVRLEEREVFPLIEAAMPQSAAEALAEAVVQAERARKATRARA
jgi:hemerythrin-like domain-containing protein